MKRLPLDRIAMAVLLGLAGFVGGRAWLHEHPEHNPWAPLNLSDPPGWATAQAGQPARRPGRMPRDAGAQRRRLHRPAADGDRRMPP